MSKPYPLPIQDEIFFGLGKMEQNAVIEIPEVKVRFYPEDNKRFKGSFRAPEDISSFVRDQLFEAGELNVQEKGIAIFINPSGEVIGYWRQAIGGVDRVIIDTRIILLAAVKCLAAGIILAHNHPSGVAQPSLADLQTTESFIQAAYLFRIQVFDHIIITENGSYSFYENGIIQKIVENLLDKEMTLNQIPPGAYCVQRRWAEPKMDWEEITLTEAIHDLEDAGYWVKGTTEKMLRQGHELWTPWAQYRMIADAHQELSGREKADELRLAIKDELAQCTPGRAPKVCKYIRTLKGYRQVEEWIIEICLRDEVAIGTAILNIETELVR